MNYLHFYSKAIVTAFALLSFASGFPGESRQNKPKASDMSIRKGLRLSADLDDESKLFTTRSIMSIKVQLENESKKPVYIYKQLGFGSGGFRVTILDANSSWVPPSLIRETFPSPVLSNEDLRAIEPGKSIEDTIEIRLRDYEITPGDYTLKIEYVSPVAPSPVTKDLIVLTSDDGPLKAKAIRFKVLVSSP